MNTLKSIKPFLLLLLYVCLFSSKVQAELKPYTAVYNAYSNGFHVGESTQTLIKLEDSWLIKLNTEATGFASFFQSKPATQQQVFKTKLNQPLLLSSKSDSGKSKKNAKKLAYYDEANEQLLVRVGDETKRISITHPLSSYLLLPITAANLQPNTTLNVTLYDKGKVKQKLMAVQEINTDNLVVDVYSKGSNKRLRYIFKHGNKHVPFRIERFKNNEIKAYLELNEFNH